MTSVEEIKKLSQESIDDKDLKEIFERIEKEGSEEAKFFLKLSLFKNECHPNGKYEETYKLLFGEVTEVTIDKINGECTSYTDVVIIPKTKAVVLMTYDGFGEPDTVYVFTYEKGWVKIFL